MVPTIIPTPKQDEAWKKLRDKTTRFIGFGGGAGGGKSWLGCEWMVTNCYFYPGSKWFIGREELSRLMKSSYITFQKVCSHHKIPRDDWRLDGKYNFIEFKNGSRIDCLDLAYQPRDPMYERFGSLEYTGGWIEEAGETKFGAFDVLKSRVGRHMNLEFDLLPKIFLTYNPSKNWLYKMLYKPWKEKTLPSNYAFVQALYGDNPHTAEAYGLQLAEIKDKATKQRLKYGNWEYDDDPSVLIEYDAIIDLWTNTVDHSEEKFITIDVARHGHDKTVFYFWKGLKVYKIVIKQKQGIDVTSQMVRDFSRDERIPFSHIIADEDGVGGGVVDNCRGIKGFVNNSTTIETKQMQTALRKANYQNLKAQCYYMLAEYVNNHKIAIETENEDFKLKLEEELEQVKSKDMDRDGKLKIIDKDEVKELIGRSPDYSDTLMMRMKFELVEAIEEESISVHIPDDL